MFTPTFASVGKFGDLNASKCSVFTFTVLFPLYNWSSKYIQTSQILLLHAISIEVIRFSFASVLLTPIGICDPVNIIGLFSPWIRKLIADAVYAIVSVPWRTTKPSYLL